MYQLVEGSLNKIIFQQREKVLYKYYKNGIKILFTNGYDEIKEIKIKNK